MQTFTVGTSGIFAGLDFFGPTTWFQQQAGGLTVKLWKNLEYSFMAGLNYGVADLIATVDIPNTVIPEQNWKTGVHADFLGYNFAIETGDKLAFEVFSDSGQQFTMIGASDMICSNQSCVGNDPYLGGRGFRVGDSSAGPSDYLFRSYVSTNAIPEPGTKFMVLIGLCFLGYFVQRRKFDT